MCPSAAAVESGLAESEPGGALSRFRRSLPHTARATNDFRHGAHPVAFAELPRFREIAPDPPGWLTALRFDVDRDGAHGAWLDAGLPEPSFCVVNPRNGHAHLIYLLAAWIRTDDRAGLRHADRYARHVRRAMTEALDADSAYAGTYHHNPLCGEYRVVEGRAEPYRLAELGQHVDLYLPPAERVRHLRSVAAADDERGRNDRVFNRLRLWAYRAVAGFAYVEAWREAVRVRAETENLAAAGAKGPLNERELAGIVKSVANWVWRRFGRLTAAERAKRADANRERGRERAHARRRTAGSLERGSYVARAGERAQSALAAARAGQSPSEIARSLGVALRTVQATLLAPGRPSVPSRKVRTRHQEILSPPRQSYQKKAR